MDKREEKKNWTCEQLLRAGREWKKCFEREWPPGQFPTLFDEIVFRKKVGGGISGAASLYLEGYNEIFRDRCIEDLKKYPAVLKEKLDIDARLVKLKTRPLIGLADSGSLFWEMGHVVDVEFSLKVNPQKKTIAGAKSEKGPSK